jgi:hypothetical protein
MSASLHFETVAAAFRVEAIADRLVTSVSPDWTILDAIIEIGVDAADYEYPDNEFCLVRNETQILGYVALGFAVDGPDEKFDGPANGLVGEHCWPISPDQIVSCDLPLIDLLPLFAKHYFFFVLTGNDLSHTVSFIDIDKLPVKLCLFTLIIGLEATLLRVFSQNPNRAEKYLKLLPKGRLQQATEHAKQKATRTVHRGKIIGDDPSSEQILLATNFIDKFTILLRSPSLAAKLPFSSKREAESFFNRLQELRNAIAHSDSICAILTSPDELSDFLTKLRELMTTVEALADEAA